MSDVVTILGKEFLMKPSVSYCVSCSFIAQSKCFCESVVNCNGLGKRIYPLQFTKPPSRIHEDMDLVVYIENTPEAIFGYLEERLKRGML